MSTFVVGLTKMRLQSMKFKLSSRLNLEFQEEKSIIVSNLEGNRHIEPPPLHKCRRSTVVLPSGGNLCLSEIRS